MKKVLAILALTLAATAAQAQTRFVSESHQDLLYRDGVATYSDNNGLVALSWFRFVSKTGQNVMMDLVQVHCDTGLYRSIRAVTYVNGQVVSGGQENWSARWENPIPGSVSQRFTTICWSR